MGLTVEEAEGLLEKSPFKPETHTISFEGLEVDFLEEGLRLTLRDAVTHAREVRTGDLVFSVLAPEILFAEKSALLATKTGRKTACIMPCSCNSLNTNFAPTWKSPTCWTPRIGPPAPVR